MRASGGERKVERDLFFVQLGGFDNHRDVSRELARRFDDVNHAFKKFVTELKAQNMFESVVMMTHSDFARTLTPNSGSGTDHAWAGNYVVAGGGIKGGKIFNSFPQSLLPGAEQAGILLILCYRIIMGRPHIGHNKPSEKQQTCVLMFKRF